MTVAAFAIDHILAAARAASAAEAARAAAFYAWADAHAQWMGLA
jgi:hypothetical protein